MTIDDAYAQRVLQQIQFQNERQRRLFLGHEALGLKRSGQKGAAVMLSSLVGVSAKTIRTGMAEVERGETYSPGDRIRAPGGGRKPCTEIYDTLREDIERIVRKETYGTPTKHLRWTTLSCKKISQILASEGKFVSEKTVAKILASAGYSRQCNRKNLQVGRPDPHRDEQFAFISLKVDEFLGCGLPVISVDAKKKELIGNFKNGGTEWRKTGDPRLVLDHDFPFLALLKVTPYGIFVLNLNTGFINLGESRDTAEFAVESILRWWAYEGKDAFPKADKILITCDGGGSNGVRCRLWKAELAKFARYTQLEVHVCHFPAGTSKWNKIEHSLFSYISKNWQGQPLTDIQTVINLISSTTTETGLTVECVLDDNVYETGHKVPKKEFDSIPIEYFGDKEIYGNKNYVIHP